MQGDASHTIPRDISYTNVIRETLIPTSVNKTRKLAVHAFLEDDILELRLPPGSRLTEADLAARFGVSKTPVREALMLLENQLLITHEPYMGATVTMLTASEYVNLVTLLDNVEVPALGTVIAKRNERDVRDVEGLLDVLERSHASGDGVGYRTALQGMHTRMFSIAQNPHLDRIIADLARLSRRYEVAFTHRFADTWQMELDVIRARVAAVKAGDGSWGTSLITDAHTRMQELLVERLGTPELSEHFSSAERH